MRKLLIVLVASFSMTGCCSLFCEPTICDGETMPDPDGGGRIVDRDGEVALYGGRCIADDGT